MTGQTHNGQTRGGAREARRRRAAAGMEGSSLARSCKRGWGVQVERALGGRHLNWSPDRSAEVGFTHTLILSSMEHEW